MKKRILSLALVLVMCLALLPTFALAAQVGGIPGAWAAPANVTITDDTDYDSAGPFMLRVSYTVGADHSGFADAVGNENWSALGCTESVYYDTVLQIDWRIDGGAWHYDALWDERNEERVGADEWLFYRMEGPYGSDRANDAVFMYLPDEYGWNEYGWAAEFAAQGVSDVRPNADGNMRLDLTRHKIEARIRLATLVSGADVDAVYGEEGYRGHIILSPWSSVAAIGMGEGGAVKPTIIPKPSVSGFNVSAAQNDGTVRDGYPIFKFTLAVPDEVSKIAANATALYTDLGIEAQVNVNNGGWQDIRIGSASWAEVTSGAHTGYMPGLADGDFTKVLGGSCQFRARYHWFDGDLYSPWSDTLTFSSTAWNSDGWAIPELAQAEELGLIPEKLLSADLTQPITRAEFAAVAVKLYEYMSGVTAQLPDDRPFTDSYDNDVLRAYNLGIVDGYGNGIFKPDQLLTREQAATMLTRVYKKLTMPGWSIEGDGSFPLSFTMPAKFIDDAYIAGYAYESVYYMAANGILQGDNGRFAPNNTVPGYEAIGGAQRQHAIIISLRMALNLDA